MRSLLALGLLVACCPSMKAQAPPRLIVRGDDMGASHSVNEAILKCHKEGIQTAIEVIVPSPWFPEAVQMLKTLPEADVGVHLTLSSEWDNVKWRPLTPCPSLRDADGYFYPMIRPNKNYPGRSLAEQKWRIEDVEQEFRAQIELAKKHIPQLSHLSGHMGCSGIDESVRKLVKGLAVEYRLDIDPAERGVKNVSYRGPHATAEEKRTAILKMLDSLEPGQTYLFVEHPGLDTPELRAIHHIGYENVAADRQGVTDAWTSPEIRAAIKAKGIELVGYRGVR
jgi:predicted glycoside hydrolase/deacetylase ChbG (UPF0249 family)